MLKNVSTHNLNIIPKIRSSQENTITRLITKTRTTFITFYSQFRLKNLSNRKKIHLHAKNTIY